MPDKLENIRRKLRFRSLRRGTKESDLVIGGFAEEHLRENDQDVLSWVLDMKPPPAEFDTSVLVMLKNFKKKI
jgi:antitoxin CptB